MIALDTNILVDLLVRSQPNHKKVADWLDGLGEPIATTAVSVGELLRLLTHPRVFPSPLNLSQAVELWDNFAKRYKLGILPEEEEWWLALKNLAPSIRGNEIFDARIALCLKFNGVKEIATYDSDFKKYPFLKIVEI